MEYGLIGGKLGHSYSKTRVLWSDGDVIVVFGTFGD